jgi:arylsulfatase A-like enzyme
MNRADPRVLRPFVWSLLALGLATGCGSDAPEEEQLPPSVVLLSLDTLRADHTGFHGYERDTTPFLDELAAESMIFDHAYTTMSWTLIAHMSMLTGVYPAQHKVWTADSVLPKSVPTLAQRLKDKGYYTMWFYFPGWLNPEFGFGRDFDVYEMHNTVEEAREHIRKALAERPKNRPYFLFVHLFDIHNGVLSRVPSTLYKTPDPYGDFFLEGATEQLKGTSSKALWATIEERLPQEKHDAVVAQYDGGIRYVDDSLRAIWDEWSEPHGFDDAVIVVTSDHGEGLAEREIQYQGHGGTFEEGLRVPLLIRLPDGTRQNERISGMVSHVDIVPTLLDYLGEPEDPNLPGYSLLGGRPADQIIIAQRPQIRVIMHSPYKLVGAEPGNPAKGMIFDLEQDPLEKSPITKKTDPEKFREIVTMILAANEAQTADWHQPEPDPESTESPLSERQRRELAKIGYTDD